jgi:hypothetical protein
MVEPPWVSPPEALFHMARIVPAGETPWPS